MSLTITEQIKKPVVDCFRAWAKGWAETRGKNNYDLADLVSGMIHIIKTRYPNENLYMVMYENQDFLNTVIEEARFDRLKENDVIFYCDMRSRKRQENMILCLRRVFAETGKNYLLGAEDFRNFCIQNKGYYRVSYINCLKRFSYLTRYELQAENYGVFVNDYHARSTYGKLNNYISYYYNSRR